MVVRKNHYLKPTSLVEVLAAHVQMTDTSLRHLQGTEGQSKFQFKNILGLHSTPQRNKGKKNPYAALPKGSCKSAYPLDPRHLQCDAHHTRSGHSTSGRQTSRGTSITASISTHLWL